MNTIDLNWKTACTWRQIHGRKQIVIMSTYGKKEPTCTNILDLETQLWTMVKGDLQPSFGGYLIQ